MELIKLRPLLSVLLSEIKVQHILAVLLVILMATSAGTETITMRTWYPSPYGSYNRIKIAESLTVGSVDTPAYIVQYGSATINGPIKVTQSITGSNININKTTADTYLRSGASVTPKADINGYAAAKDIYLTDSSKWASQLGGSGISPLYGTGTSIVLSTAAEHWDVMIWSYYFTCQDKLTYLKLDSASVATYSGYGGDTDGCDQNSIFYKANNLASGTHTLSMTGTSGISQMTYMWLAFPK